MINVSIVHHTHWDREWFFSTQDSLVLSDMIFSEIIEELNKNPNLKFILDGQISIVDDYIEIYPEKKDLIQKLVEKNQLFIGPWFTQFDAILPHEESLFRNAIIGDVESSKYGRKMKIAYLPDTFGFNAQIPTIVKHMGLNKIIFWRGIDLSKLKTPYFYWKGLGEKKVLAINITNSYASGLDLKSSDEYIDQKLVNTLESLNYNNKLKNIILPSGNDQHGIDASIVNTIEELNNKIDDYKFALDDYESIAKKIEEDGVNVEYCGDFRVPKYARVHRTIGSARHSIKTLNKLLESKLINETEPLMVMAKKLGIHLSDKLVIKAWKKVLESQAHDAIGGCVTDNAAQDIIQRYKESLEIVEGIRNTILRKIAISLDLTDKEILLINTELSEFHGYKEIKILSKTKNIKISNAEESFVIKEEYIPPKENTYNEQEKKYFTDDAYYILTLKTKVRIPSFGYKVLEIEDTDDEIICMKKKSENFIGNSKFNIKFENNKIIYSEDDRHLENFITLVDSGNDGDTYDYSPVANESEKELSFDECYKLTSDFEETLVIKGEEYLPYDLNERNKENPIRKKMSYELRITVRKKDNLIRCSLKVNNTIKSHRLRIRINTNIENNVSIAQIQNGFYSNSNLDIDKNWRENYQEKPVNIFNFHKSISKSDENNSVTVFSDSMYEYENNDRYIFLTCFSTTSELGKPDLEWRPGRASGNTTVKGHVMLKTPNAEELGEHNFEFNILFNKIFDENTVYNLSKEIYSRSVYYQLQDINYFINRLDNRLHIKGNKNIDKKDISLLNFEGYYVSAVYNSYYDDNAIIVRLNNPTSQSMKLENLNLDDNYKFVNAIEEVIAMQDEIKPYDFVSIKIYEN